jgi:NRPS condensation-like uncharacterized protein
MSVADISEREELATSESALQFPLAFTPFERLMLLDDRPDYPMTIHVELSFTGRMDKQVFFQAMQQTVARHPLLAARVEWRGRWPFWLGSSPSPVKISWTEAEPPVGVMRPTQIDILEGPGVEAHVHVGSGTTSVLVMFHHSCCDGQGARRFLFDLTTAYERLALGENSTRGMARADQLLEERLRKRHEFAAPAVKEVKVESTTTLWQRIKNTVAHVTTRAERLSGPQKGKAHRPGLVHNVLLGVEETSNLRKRAQEESATFNDVAVAKLMQISCDWNRRHENALLGTCGSACRPTCARRRTTTSPPPIAWATRS